MLGKCVSTAFSSGGKVKDIDKALLMLPPALPTRLASPAPPEEEGVKCLLRRERTFQEGVHKLYQ